MITIIMIVKHDIARYGSSKVNIYLKIIVGIFMFHIKHNSCCIIYIHDGSCKTSEIYL